LSKREGRKPHAEASQSVRLSIMGLRNRRRRAATCATSKSHGPRVPCAGSATFFSFRFLSFNFFPACVTTNHCARTRWTRTFLPFRRSDPPWGRSLWLSGACHRSGVCPRWIRRPLLLRPGPPVAACCGAAPCPLADTTKPRTHLLLRLRNIHFTTRQGIRFPRAARVRHLDINMGGLSPYSFMHLPPSQLSQFPPTDLRAPRQNPTSSVEFRPSPWAETVEI